MIGVLPNPHGSGYRPAPIGDSIARQCYSTLLGPPLAVTRLTTLREKNSGILGPADLLLKKAAESRRVSTAFYHANMGIVQPEEEAGRLARLSLSQSFSLGEKVRREPRLSSTSSKER